MFVFHFSSSRWAPVEPASEGTKWSRAYFEPEFFYVGAREVLRTLRLTACSGLLSEWIRSNEFDPAGAITMPGASWTSFLQIVVRSVSA